MRKVVFVSLMLGLAGISPVLASCDSKNNEPDPGSNTPSAVSVTVAPEALTAGVEASTVEFTVTANADWSLSTEADWLTLQPRGGSKDTPTKVKASVSKNNTMDPRIALIDVMSGGKTVKTVTLEQSYELSASLSQQSMTFGAQPASATFTVTANTDWQLTTSDGWLSVAPENGGKGETQVTVSVLANETSSTREGAVTLAYGGKTLALKVSQLTDEIAAPEGYTLVWNDEFNAGPLPGPDWQLENWAPGHVNNELQTYTSKEVDGKRTAEIKDGFLYINCFKAGDGKIYSARMNAKPSTGWLYGYFEARINLPKGKGTWPAFWMMPCNVDWGKNPWPYCGEIDIMEEVGADPNEVSSSLHTGNYNHTIGTQKTHAMYLPGAEGEFHVYACEWTPDEIITYVDGKVQLKATKAQMGADHDSWPFHYAFYPILNLAWGGDWGGYKGVDDSVLPVSMIVDYVRIFQKK